MVALGIALIAGATLVTLGFLARGAYSERLEYTEAHDDSGKDERLGALEEEQRRLARAVVDLQDSINGLAMRGRG